MNICVFLIIFPLGIPLHHAKVLHEEENQMIRGDVKSCYNCGGITNFEKAKFLVRLGWVFLDFRHESYYEANIIFKDSLSQNVCFNNLYFLRTI